MLIDNLEKCPCVKKKCERHGKCDECIEKHSKDEKRPLPYCRRKKKK